MDLRSVAKGLERRDELVDFLAEGGDWLARSMRQAQAGWAEARCRASAHPQLAEHNHRAFRVQYGPGP